MRKTKSKTTRLIVAASENDADMLYAFVIPSEVEESLLKKGDAHFESRGCVT